MDGVGGGNSSVGTVDGQGNYTAPSETGTHTIGVTVAGLNATASASIAVFTVSVSPTGTLARPGATQQFTASLHGIANTDVTWSIDGTIGGNASVGTISTTGLYTAPNSTGAHTITATSVAFSSFSSTVQIMVPNANPGAVLTYHNDDERDGAFTEETTLMPSVVNSSQFGKLQSYPVDGQMYAQPLYVPQLEIGGANHNVVFVATENNTVYAFDADGVQSAPLWSRSIGTPSPRNDLEGISPMIGITSTRSSTSPLALCMSSRP